MQVCAKCQKPFIEGEQVIMKCLASFHRFVEGIHAIDVTEELSLVHEGCDEDDE